MSRSLLADLASRALRGAFIVTACSAGLGIVLSVILWNADLFELRDRYERGKLALFGEWEPNLWCPPGRVAEECERVDEFEAALEAASDFTFFRTETIAATGHEVVTGVEFTTARDVVHRRYANKWCYVNVSAGGFSRHISLASQSAGEAPVYAILSSLDEGALAGSRLSVDLLSRVARTHCRFDE